MQKIPAILKNKNTKNISADDEVQQGGIFGEICGEGNQGILADIWG